jgi:hypothetical protein
LDQSNEKNKKYGEKEKTIFPAERQPIWSKKIQSLARLKLHPFELPIKGS